MENLIVFILANESWGPVWFSKQWYAAELAALGYQVYFVNPPRPWRPTSGGFKVTLDIEGVQVIQYRNPFPNRLGAKANERWLLARLQGLLSSSAPALLWQFDPFRLWRTPLPIGWQRIYHVADPYMHLPQDSTIARSADLVLATSPKYMAHYESLGVPVLHVPHGTASHPVMPDAEAVSALHERYGDFVLLVGTFNRDVDYALLQQLADAIPGTLVLAGPDHLYPHDREERRAFRQLLAHPRVQWVGSVPATELPAWARAARVGLAAYRFTLNKAIGTGSPLKILTYIRQQLPVVTSIDPDIEGFPRLGIFWERDAAAYIGRVLALLSGAPAPDQSGLEAYLEEVRYDRLIGGVMEKVSRRGRGRSAEGAEIIPSASSAKNTPPPHTPNP